MRLRRFEVFIILLCSAGSLASDSQGDPDLSHEEHGGRGNSPLSEKDSLEDELVKLRYPGDEYESHTSPYSVVPQHKYDAESAFLHEDLDEELTEVRPLDIPADHHETPEDQYERRFASSTVGPLDTDIPAFELDEDDDSASAVVAPTDRATRQDKRSRKDDDDDNDDDDDDDDDVYDEDDDDDDDDDDFEDDDEHDKVEKRTEKEVLNSPVDQVEGRRETEKGETTRDALMKDLDSFLTNKKRSAGEADFQGLSKLNQIREIDKRISRELKAKYVDAVDPKADEDLLELMVKIAENPSEWRTVHRMLQQMDQDLVASHDVVDKIKGNEGLTLEKGEEVDNVTTKKPIKNRTKEQSEKKKKKKKKLHSNKGVTKLPDESTTANSVESMRRDELFRAGILTPHVVAGDNEWQDTSNSKLPGPTKPLTPSKAKDNQWLPKEMLAEKTPIPLGAENRMNTINSAIDYLTAHKTKISNNKYDRGHLKMISEKNDRWPKELLGVDKELDTAKAIVTGELKPSEWSSKNNLPNASINQKIEKPPKTVSDGGWSTSNIASDYIRDKEAARAKFLKDTLVPKNNAVYFQPSARAAWLAASPMPSKEQRANTNNNYFNPNYNKPYDWPQISLDSLKHGNMIPDQKNWPDFEDDRSYNQANHNQESNWPNLPVGSDGNNKVDNEDNWPSFSNNEVAHNDDSGRGNSWDKYSSALDSALTKHREMTASRWPSGPPQKPSITVSHPKDVANNNNNNNNRQWPHFAYHRVTSSPQTMARHQKEAQQRARHRNAYIAVSIIAPPSKNKSNKTLTLQKQNSSNEHSQQVNNNGSTLPDKMDDLLDARGDKTPRLTLVDPLEEQLIDMAATGRAGHTKFNWDHSRHLDKIQEQLKTLSAMEEKLHFQWLEKERLRQILRDGGKSGSYYREPRDGSRALATSSPSPAIPRTNV